MKEDLILLGAGIFAVLVVSMVVVTFASTAGGCP